MLLGAVRVLMVRALVVLAILILALGGSLRRAEPEPQARNTHFRLNAIASSCYPRTPLGNLYRLATGAQRRVVNAFVWGNLTELEFVQLAQAVGVHDRTVYCLVMRLRERA